MDLSIIIPVYNVEKYIIECLDSIYKYDSSIKYEVLCIDDCGLDNSINLINDYVKKNKVKNLSIIKHKKNSGLSASRNTGINHAKGKYLCFVDSDDMINHESLDCLVQYALKHNLDVVEGNYIEIFETSQNISTNNRIDDVIKEGIIYTGDSFFELMMKSNYTPMVWRRIYSKNYLTKNNIHFEPGLKFEDEEFTPRAILTAKKVSHYNLDLYIYRRRDDSITTTMTRDNKWVDHYLKIINNLNAFSEKLDNKDSYKVLKNRIGEITLSLYKNPISYGSSKENYNEIVKLVLREKLYLNAIHTYNFSTKMQGILMKTPKLFFWLYSHVNRGVNDENNK